MSKLQRLKTYRKERQRRYAPMKLHAEDVIRILDAPLDLSWRRRFRHLSAEEQDEIVTNPATHFWPRKGLIAQQATTHELIRALDLATTTQNRAIVCEILGWGRSPTAILALVKCINDRSPRVRYEAVDAIGNIAMRLRHFRKGSTLSDIIDPVTGETLLRQFVKEQAWKKPNNLLPSVLGAIGYLPAIPVLIHALERDDRWIRRFAAWSLQILDAREACPPLVKALDNETFDDVALVMRQALVGLGCMDGDSLQGGEQKP